MPSSISTRPHYLLLDALRGVAALIVLYYHLFEGFATSLTDQHCNHGYLAVDFFFLLSGFVIAYAYDDRFHEQRITTLSFFRRRLIRLHPMVIFGAILGAITFLIQGSNQWDFAGNGAPAHISISWVMIALLLNLFMLPNVPGKPFEVRGNGELFPLNGPHWSLFFEYIGNILYALLLRRASTFLLSILSALSGIALAYITLSNGYLGVGWTLPDFWFGLIRMLFPYTTGMLLARLYMHHKLQPTHLPLWLRRNAFWLCSALLILLLSIPFVGSESAPWQNGLYILFIVFIVFPLIIWLSVTGSELLNTSSPHTQRLCTFLGNLSYPLYAIHYPLMYLFYNYIGFPHVSTSPTKAWPIMLGLYIACILLAVLVLYLYDLPIRRLLSKKSR